MTCCYITGGDHTIAVVRDSEEAAAGEQMLIGPIPSTLRTPTSSHPTPTTTTAPAAQESQLSRPHGAGCTPISLPNLLELAAGVAQQGMRDGGTDGNGAMSHASPLRPRPPPSPLAGAPAPKRPHGLDSTSDGGGSSSNSPARGPAAAPDHAQLHRLLGAVEDVFSSPGFLAAGFAAPSAGPHAVTAGSTQPGDSGSNTSSGDSAALQELLSSLGIPWHGLDTTAITAVYQVGILGEDLDHARRECVCTNRSMTEENLPATMMASDLVLLTPPGCYSGAALVTCRPSCASIPQRSSLPWAVHPTAY